MRFLSIPSNKDVWLCLAIAVSSTCGYLLATYPITIIDPLLDHRIGLGAVSYPYGWLIWPIALVLFSATFLLMYSASTNLQRLVAAVVPLGVVCIVSMFFLRPPFPRPNIMFVGTIWISITSVWILIRYSLFSDDADTLVGVDKEACIQFIREQLTFSRTLLLGLAGAYIGLVVTALSATYENNKLLFPKETKTAESNAIAEELLLVNRNTQIQFSAISLFFLFGPIIELAKRRRCLSSLFLNIRSSSRIELIDESHGASNVNELR